MTVTTPLPLRTNDRESGRLTLLIEEQAELERSSVAVPVSLSEFTAYVPLKVFPWHTPPSTSRSIVPVTLPFPSKLKVPTPTTPSYDKFNAGKEKAPFRLWLRRCWVLEA